MLNRPRTRSRERAQCDDARAFSFPEHAVPRCKHPRAFQLRVRVRVCVCLRVRRCERGNLPRRDLQFEQRYISEFSEADGAYTFIRALSIPRFNSIQL